VQEQAGIFAKAAAALRGNSDKLVPTDGNFPYSLRTTRPRWIKKTSSNEGTLNDPKLGEKVQKYKSGAPIIIFVLGGISFNEMRCVYQVAREMNRLIYLGKILKKD
jgi:hypothetical protein